MEALGDFLNSAVEGLGGYGPLAVALRALRALLTAFAIIAAFNAAQMALGRLMRSRVSQPRAFVVRKAVKYAGFAAAAFSLFGSIGVDTSALLGAAGIIGIAVGFAAQTTVSSFISGFFLLSEKPFHVGDVIRVGEIKGEVLSVDILSVKIRTFDNLYVRIPNETLFKSNLVNQTRFPIRRLDILLSATYREDLERLRSVLLSIARDNPWVLDSPEPCFRVDGFDRAGPQINFNVWFEKSQIVEARTSMHMAIQKRFAEEGIEIPYQKLDVTVGEAAQKAARAQPEAGQE